MKKLIDLFNKKYGSVYGVIDDSIDNEDVYKVYKIIKSLCSNDEEIMTVLEKVKLPNPKTAKESIEKININVSGGLSKEYVDEKTEILPVKGSYTILTDATPSRIEGDINTYGGIASEYHIFESLQNEDMILSAIKYNLNITFNDGTNDRTMDLIIDELYNGNGRYESDDLYIEALYSRTDHVIGIMVLNPNDITMYSVLKATLSCEAYSNLLQNRLIQSINYNKIENVPSNLSRIANGQLHTLTDKEYHNLYDNLFIWDENKFNERLDENSGVKQNLSIAHMIQVKQKDSEGIGFGQHIPVDSSSGLFIVANTGADVIIKVYNSTTKELIDTLDYLEYGKYKTLTLDTYELNGVSSVFLAFTVKDSVKNFYGNTYIYDLIVYNNSSFLTKGELLTKTNTKEYIPSGDYNPATKKYVDDKTEILPVKNTYTIFEDAVPSSTEVASTYSNSGGFEYYIFDSLQNEDMIISAVKYNLNVTFNDGTNDRTMDLIIENSLKGGAFCEKDGFAVQVSYSEAYHAIEMILVNANNHTQYSILKATLNCDAYSNLLQNHLIQNINYNKIEEVPGELDGIVNRKYFTLEGKEYYELYDNLSIWDANKFNEQLDENSGVKRNEFFKLLGKDNYTMKIKQKDSEGIGFGQHISIDNSKNVHIVADAGVDVIIKIYNSTTKELIGTLNYCEAGFYKTRIINKDYLNGVTSIFIAFTVKDSTESFYGNTYVNDLIVHYDSSFLVKEEILTKTNTKEYIPTGDYNPATKKYVDEKIASIDTTINTLPVNGSLNLTTSKFQTTTLATDTEVILPTVEGYTEIHLFFLGISGTNVSDTNVAWNSKPTIEDNKKYEFIYTYVNSEIGWLGKAVVYTV